MFERIPAIRSRYGIVAALIVGMLILGWAMLDAIGNVDTAKSLLDAEHPHWLRSYFMGLAIPQTNLYAVYLACILFIWAVYEARQLRTKEGMEAKKEGKAEVRLNEHHEGALSVLSEFHNHWISTSYIAVRSDIKPALALLRLHELRKLKLISQGPLDSDTDDSTWRILPDGLAYLANRGLLSDNPPIALSFSAQDDPNDDTIKSCICTIRSASGKSQDIKRYFGIYRAGSLETVSAMRVVSKARYENQGQDSLRLLAEDQSHFYVVTFSKMQRKAYIHDRESELPNGEYVVVLRFLIDGKKWHGENQIRVTSSSPFIEWVQQDVKMRLIADIQAPLR